MHEHLYFCDECSCFGGDGKLCACDVRRLREVWRALSVNLAIAGAMQAMFDAGRKDGAFWTVGDMHWRPNVDGRAMPGRET
jgi:hypothetical protein